MSGSGSAGTVGAVGGLPLQLVRRDGSSIDTSAALAGADYIGLYFSAHVRRYWLLAAAENVEELE